MCRGRLESAVIVWWLMEKSVQGRMLLLTPLYEMCDRNIPCVVRIWPNRVMCVCGRGGGGGGGGGGGYTHNITTTTVSMNVFLAYECNGLLFLLCLCVCLVNSPFANS